MKGILLIITAVIVIVYFVVGIIIALILRISSKYDYDTGYCLLIIIAWLPVLIMEGSL